MGDGSTVVRAYQQWRETRAQRLEKRAQQLRYASGQTGLAHQFSAISNLFRAAIGLGAAVYLLELFLVTVHSTSLLQEDGLVETLTAIVFLSGGLIALRHLRQDRTRWISIILCVAGFVGFLDELSFGHRLIGYEAITIRGVRIDAVHDILELPYRLVVAQFSSGQTAALASFLAFGIVIAAWTCRTRLQELWGCSRVIPFFLFAASASALAFLVDEGFEDIVWLSTSPVVASCEEIFEFLAAAAILCAASTRALEVSIQERTRSSGDGSKGPLLES